MIPMVSLRESLGRRLNAIGPTPEGRTEGDELNRLVRLELAELADELGHVWRQCVTGPASPPPLEITSKWRLDAEIGPIGSADPIASVSIGTILALDDLCLTCCSDPLFLAPSRDAIAIGDPGAPFAPDGWDEIAGARRDRDGRFVDYQQACSPDGDLDLADLHYAVPTPAWRLAQAELLATLAQAFILLHEYCHWGLGHLDALAGEDTVGLSFSELDHVGVGEGQGDGDELRRVMELQADAQAFMILTRYAEATNGLCDRYEADIAEMGVAPHPTRFTTLAKPDRHRLCVVAAALACLALRSAEDLAALPRGRTHPSPGARLMSMVVVTPLLSDLAQQNEAGDWILDTRGDVGVSLDELTFRVIGMALIDLQSASSLINQDILPLEGAWNDRPKATSAWLQDLASFWVAVDEDVVRQPQSPAGLELQALKALEQTLVPRLEALQLTRFGELFRTHLD